MSEGWEDPRGLAEQRLGSVLNGRWRLDRVLARGGSAWIYVARDQRDGGEAAVKVLHSRLVAHREIVRRFVREARVANVVQHAGVVRLLDDGTCADGVPFLVTELLDGETLEERRVRKGGRLPITEVLWAADRVLSILAVAHTKGVLHRDIKPENVFITHARVLKLLDFGIARLTPDAQRQSVRQRVMTPIEVLAAADDDAPPASEYEPTRIGITLGTLDFMSPEQARGDWDNVGAQTDLWALGATMFTLLCGRTVHDEPDFGKQLSAVSTRPAPSIAVFAPDLPREVVDLVDQALVFDAGRRWTTARAMRFALRFAYRAAMGEGATDDDEEEGIPQPPLHVGPEPPPMSIVRR